MTSAALFLVNPVSSIPIPNLWFFIDILSPAFTLTLQMIDCHFVLLSADSHLYIVSLALVHLL